MFKKLPCLKVNLESLKAQLLQEPARVDIHLENLSLRNYFPRMKYKQGYIFLTKTVLNIASKEILTE